MPDPETIWPQTPGLPGVFARFQWVDSPEFGEPLAERRASHGRDIDPAPLARMIGIALELIDGNLDEAVAAIADDDRDGPIRLVHLLAACEYAGRQYGGGLPGPGAQPLDPLTAFDSGSGIPVLAAALRSGGLPAAAAEARGMSHDLRFRVLYSLLGFWRAPVDGLMGDITDEHVRRPV